MLSNSRRATKYSSSRDLLTTRSNSSQSRYPSCRPSNDGTFRSTLVYWNRIQRCFPLCETTWTSEPSNQRLPSILRKRRSSQPIMNCLSSSLRKASHRRHGSRPRPGINAQRVRRLRPSHHAPGSSPWGPEPTHLRMANKECSLRPTQRSRNTLSQPQLSRASHTARHDLCPLRD